MPRMDSQRRRPKAGFEETAVDLLQARGVHPTDGRRKNEPRVFERALASQHLAYLEYPGAGI
jgi:hypothetical protein